MKPLHRIWVALACAALLVMGRIPVKAQQASGHYFPETGHNVAGEFWSYYQTVPDASVVFGLPVSEQFTSSDGSGLTVQYFEKTRFELHPDQPLGRQVTLTDLGSFFYKSGAPSINTTTPGACRTMNGFGVCYDFLTFYDRYGGTAIFGEPLSAFEFQPDGRLVQYFERARFEWHPELPTGQNVVLTDYGWLYANNREDPSWLSAALPLNNIPIQLSAPVSLRAQIFVAKAVTLPADSQKIFVIVQDQTLAPVFGATGTVAVHFSQGDVRLYPVVTGPDGVAVLPELNFSGLAAGDLVTVDVAMTYQGLTDPAAASFLVWR